MSRPEQPEILLIHGMWSRPSFWDGWIERLTQAGYSCKAVALRREDLYSGDVPLPEIGRLGIRDYVERIKLAVLQCHSPPILIGHSLGGLLSQIVAAEMDVAAVVLVNSAAPAAVFPMRPVMMPGLIRTMMRYGVWRQPFKLSSWEANYLFLNRLPEQDRSSIFQSLVFESGRVLFEAGLGKLNFRRTNLVDKAAIQCPMLFLAGTEDRIIPLSVSRSMAKWYGSKLTYREYAGYSHWLLGEPGWQDILEHSLAWLERHVLKSSAEITTGKIAT